MSKRSLRWLIPVIVMALVVAYFAFAPAVAMHASGWNFQ